MKKFLSISIFLLFALNANSADPSVAKPNPYAWPENCAIGTMDRVITAICNDPRLKELSDRIGNEFLIASKYAIKPTQVQIEAMQWHQRLIACKDTKCIEAKETALLGELQARNKPFVDAASAAAESARKLAEENAIRQAAQTDALSKQQADDAIAAEVKKQVDEALATETKRKAEEAAVAETARQTAEAAAVQAKLLADKAEAEQKQLLLIASAVVGLAVILLGSWFWLRRSKRQVKHQPIKQSEITKPAIPREVPIQAASNLGGSTAKTEVEIDEKLKYFDKEKVTQTLNSVKDRVSSTSSLLKGNVVETSKKLGDDLNKINEAKNQALKESDSEKADSKVHAGNVAKSFWVKLSIPQKAVVAVIVIACIAVIGYFAKAIAIGFVLVLGIMVLVGMYTKRTSIKQGAIELFVVIAILGFLVPTPESSSESSSSSSESSSSISSRGSALQQLQRAYISYDERCRKMLGESDAEFLSKVRTYKKGGGNIDFDNAPATRTQLQRAQNFGCAPK